MGTERHFTHYERRTPSRVRSKVSAAPVLLGNAQETFAWSRARRWSGSRWILCSLQGGDRWASGRSGWVVGGQWLLWTMRAYVEDSNGESGLSR